MTEPAAASGLGTSVADEEDDDEHDEDDAQTAEDAREDARAAVARCAPRFPFLPGHDVTEIF